MKYVLREKAFDQSFLNHVSAVCYLYLVKQKALSFVSAGFYCERLKKYELNILLRTLNANHRALRTLLKSFKTKVLKEGTDH